MSPKTSRHRQPLAADRGPVYVIDAATDVTYVLVPAEEYQRLRPRATSDEPAIRETYPLQERVARLSGWDAPAMDVYDDDSHRRSR